MNFVDIATVKKTFLPWPATFPIILFLFSNFDQILILMDVFSINYMIRIILKDF